MDGSKRVMRRMGDFSRRNPSQNGSMPVPTAVIGPMPVITTRWCVSDILFFNAAQSVRFECNASQRAVRDETHELVRDDMLPRECADKRPGWTGPRVGYPHVCPGCDGLERPLDD